MKWHLRILKASIAKLTGFSQSAEGSKKANFFTHKNLLAMHATLLTNSGARATLFVLW